MGYEGKKPVWIRSIMGYGTGMALDIRRYT